MKRHEAPSTRAEESAAKAAILAALGEHVPGFAPAEHDVDLAGGRRPKGTHDVRADVVGMDRSGRLVLAALKEGGDDESILWAVEALALAGRMHADSGADSVRARCAAADWGRAPLVVLIVRTSSARLLAALSLLPAESLCLLEAQHRRGTGTAKLVLVRRDTRAEGGAPRDIERGIEAWPSDARRLAESLAARVRRIDPSIERTDSTQGVRFLFREEEAARLSLQGGKLVGAHGAASETARIEDDPSADAWLEETLLRHAVRLRSAHRATRPADLLTRAGPLLSPEELAAFRDD